MECVLSKSEFCKRLDAFDILDVQGLSPYIAISIPDGDTCHMYRSSISGYIRTSGALEITDPKANWVFVSFSHLRACINVLPTETVKLWVVKDHVGMAILHVGEVSDVYKSDIRVSSTGYNRSGMKSHTIGKVDKTIPHGWFGSFRYPSSMKLVCPPLIHENHVMLITMDGGVRFEGLHPLNLGSSPMVPILRAVSDYPNHDVTISDHGYYSLKTPDFEFVVMGHHIGTDVVKTFVGDKPVGEMTTDRLLVALYACSRLSDTTSVVTINLQDGIISTDGEFGNPIKFHVDKDIPVQSKISRKAALLIYDTLKNSTSKTTKVYINTNKNGTRTIIFESGVWAGSSIIA